MIGLPDLVKERKLSKIVINRRLPYIYYYISREFHIQNFQSHATIYSDGEYCHSFVIAAVDSKKISVGCLIRNADARTVRLRQ